MSTFHCWRRPPVLAQDEEPTIDVQQVLDDVERLLKRVTARMPEEADDLTRSGHPDAGFLQRPGIWGERQRLLRPENSYIVEVLRTRRGIADFIGGDLAGAGPSAGACNAQGISFPGHFLVKVALEGGLGGAGSAHG